MKTVIIIPTYNERENIVPLIEALGNEHTILVVDDESPDGTAAVVKETLKQENIKTRKQRSDIAILTGQKEGIGRALQRGINYAIENLDAEVIVQMDADFSHDPKDVPCLLDEIKNGYDLVIGSRYIKGGAIPAGWGLHRKVLSWGGNLLVRLMTGLWSVHEFTTNFRAFTVELYQKMEAKNFSLADNTFLPAFVVEAKRVNAKIKEVPIVFADRKKGRSKIEVAKYIPNLLKYLLTLLRSSLRSELRRVFAPH